MIVYQRQNERRQCAPTFRQWRKTVRTRFSQNDAQESQKGSEGKPLVSIVFCFLWQCLYSKRRDWSLTEARSDVFTSQCLMRFGAYFKVQFTHGSLTIQTETIGLYDATQFVSAVHRRSLIPSKVAACIHTR